MTFTSNSPAAIRSAPAVRDQIARFVDGRASAKILDTLVGAQANMVMLGERHKAGDYAKATLITSIVLRAAWTKPVATHFHASERFHDDQQTLDAMQAIFSTPRPARLKHVHDLHEEDRAFFPVLDAAADYPGRRCTILPCGVWGGSPDQRHASIAAAFRARTQLTRSPSKVGMNASWGTFLIGAFHAARKPYKGAGPTANQRLTQSGWRIRSVRVSTAVPYGTQPPEVWPVQVIAAGASSRFDLIEVLNRCGAGQPFIVDLDGEESPFELVREGADKVLDVPLTELYDSILHIPSGWMVYFV